jgi:hypothetical protein
MTVLDIGLAGLIKLKCTVNSHQFLPDQNQQKINQ